MKFANVLRRFCAEHARNSRKTNGKMHAFGWRAPRKACDFGAEVARGCAACAAPSPLMTRNVCAEIRACFPQILRRTRTRRAQKQMQECARSAGKRAISAKKIARGCAACAAPSPPMTGNVCNEIRECFEQILRRTRAQLAQNKCKNARVRPACTTNWHKKRAILARKLRKVAPRMQRHRR